MNSEWMVTIPTKRLEQEREIHGAQYLIVTARNELEARKLAAKLALRSEMRQRRRHAEADLERASVEPYIQPRLAW
ncbi:hypothetical protein [Streptomyces tendae]|uniref:hypothetical protein n=1 Tax=Streptomycetaceae TaxID=2062 RepID=UPI00331BF846